MNSVESLDATLDAKVVLVAGTSTSASKKGQLVACSFDGHFDFINKLEFDDEISRVRRLTCSDIFLVGSWTCIVFTQFSNKKMTKLGSINDLFTGLVSWIEPTANEIYVMERGGKEVRRIEFNFLIDGYEMAESK